MVLVTSATGPSPPPSAVMVPVVLSRLEVVTLAQDCDGPNVDDVSNVHDKSQNLCNEANDVDRYIYFLFL